MEFATSKELRVRTKEILERVKAGERFVITYRGRPEAWMVPFESAQPDILPRPFQEAWAEIERVLEETEPFYPDWEEALKESRRRR